jgi:hypothetical protein
MKKNEHGNVVERKLLLLKEHIRYLTNGSLQIVVGGSLGPRSKYDICTRPR